MWTEVAADPTALLSQKVGNPWSPEGGNLSRIILQEGLSHRDRRLP